MRNYILVISFILAFGNIEAQRHLTLDSCRALAIKNNKQLLITSNNAEAADYMNKAAKTQYLPKLSADASYIYNTETINLLSKDQKTNLGNLGTNAAGSIGAVAQNIIQQYPDLAPLVQNLGTQAVPTLNQLGQEITNAFETNTHNIFAGSLILTQPLYMGGRIKAYNNITHYTKILLGEQYDNQLQEVILQTDQAYWQVVSLEKKKELAEKYLELLNKLNNDVEKMYKEGVATKASVLNVSVKQNEAEVTLTKVENGLSLSKMLLCQLCGIPLDENITLEGEKELNVQKAYNTYLNADTTQAFLNRADLKALETATQIANENVKLARSMHMPMVGLFGAYTLSNPNVYNGFQNKFGDNWRIGITVHVPIWQWNESKYHIRAAKAQAKASMNMYEEAKELIQLQLKQAKYKTEEAGKKLQMTEKNMNRAEENLHYANVGFHEGVIPTSDLLAAQTAWLNAYSQKIDAQIDVKITEATLIKALGK